MLNSRRFQLHYHNQGFLTSRHSQKHLGLLNERLRGIVFYDTPTPSLPMEHIIGKYGALFCYYNRIGTALFIIFKT